MIVLLTREHFGEFFAATNNGHPPFAWQYRLLDHVLDTGTWPEHITAPTGAGKTSVIDVHVFAQALVRLAVAPRLPRRLVITVNRRSIVDSHWSRAEHVQQVLESAPPGSVAAQVADSLRQDEDSPPFRVVGMRGGLVADRSWVDDPVSAMVVVATPDMWGSRLLFRGYGTSKLARPREAGLLAHDAVVVIDEAHLNRQLEVTARRVSDMASAVSIAGVPPLQVVSTTATPEGPGVGSVGVEESDLSDDRDPLTRRLTRPKRLAYVAQAGWKPGVAPVAQRLADEVVRVLPASPQIDRPTTVLCVVNTVAMALRVHQLLADRCGRERVALWVGRMRPHDLQQMQMERPGLFTVDGEEDIDVLVTTQTVEVGVDIDCAALVTEIAPGSSLAQRAGRVNRLGRLDEAPVVVVGPEDPPTRDAPPYTGADLARAFQWLQTLGDDADVSPWALATSRPPTESVERLALSELSPARVEILAETTEDHACEDDLAFWLRDDLQEDRAPVGFVVRSPLPQDDGDAMSLLSSVPVDAAEVFPATIATGRLVLDSVLAHQDHGRAFLVRDELVIGVLRAGQGESAHNAALPHVDGLAALDLRPGDTLIIDQGHAVTTAGVVTAAPAGHHERVEALWGRSKDGAIVEVRSDDRPASLLLDAIDDFRDAHHDASVEEVSAAVRDVLPDENWRILLPPLTVESPVPWVAAVPTSELNRDPVLRESWTISADHVPLAQHQAAVGRRATEIATSCGLATDLVEALELSGEHHDDGKADARFQQGVLGAPEGVLLAKGRWQSPQAARRSAARYGLPPRWRHEQLSVVVADSGLRGEQRDLVLRLVGTSHGHGRPFFPHGAASLVGTDGEESVRGRAVDLFGTGAGWSEIIERTDMRHGPWGSAYLEALLRAADCQVSKEGS